MQAQPLSSTTPPLDHSPSPSAPESTNITPNTPWLSQMPQHPELAATMRPETETETETGGTVDPPSAKVRDPEPGSTLCERVLRYRCSLPAHPEHIGRFRSLWYYTPMPLRPVPEADAALTKYAAEHCPRHGRPAERITWNVPPGVIGHSLPRRRVSEFPPNYTVLAPELPSTDEEMKLLTPAERLALEEGTYEFYDHVVKGLVVKRDELGSRISKTEDPAERFELEARRYWIVQEIIDNERERLFVVVWQDPDFEGEIEMIKEAFSPDSPMTPRRARKALLARLRDTDPAHTRHRQALEYLVAVVVQLSSHVVRGPDAYFKGEHARWFMLDREFWRLECSMTAGQFYQKRFGYPFP